MEHTELSEQVCKPCKEGTPPLKHEKISELKSRLAEGWEVVDDHHLEKKFKFKNFKKALDFTNRVGGLAEAQQHHPDIFLSWGKVKLKLFTHKINGLSESDFIFAAKIDKLDSCDI